jgi:hypothetical protein
VREDLSGYNGARPVRVGNAAFDQQQNDVWQAEVSEFDAVARRFGRWSPPGVPEDVVARAAAAASRSYFIRARLATPETQHLLR